MSCVLAPPSCPRGGLVSGFTGRAFLHSYSKKGGWHVSAAVDINVDAPDCSTAA